MVSKSLCSIESSTKSPFPAHTAKSYRGIILLPFSTEINFGDSIEFLNNPSFDKFYAVIEPVFVRGNNKELVKQDCFDYIFELLKQRFKGEKIKNIDNIQELLRMMDWTFGSEIIQWKFLAIWESIVKKCKELLLEKYKK